MDNSQYELPGEWWTVPADAEDGELIMVSGRSDIDKFRTNPRFNIRVQITWKYGDKGMPDEAVSKLMQQTTEALGKEFSRDPVAVLTGIYTGAGQRDWIFYTLSLNIFGRKLNEVLAALPLLPIKINAESDTSWAEFDEMSSVKD